MGAALSSNPEEHYAGLSRAALEVYGAERLPELDSTLRQVAEWLALIASAAQDIELDGEAPDQSGVDWLAEP